ncbi:SUMO-activating enzyme subunit 1B-1 isoform X1 [Amborella trichopoda]|nr:SUMO-activating enzyme subunit 1B-1 isoform X1 [Amborella trichopoda]XP_011624875.1 SUMO-activating enzyme subunit 1B-1 isoform X1 [Amborella trichopoda]XP_020525375.1 SUMO-activating enzyme subunit 1B-1 isoform X1 [Amborella trichopoda]|eukprot:XP_011624873.1 SUMO-activating enzyme subunit 1B-1 isoform X1 [Amborella trichopoda]
MGKEELTAQETALYDRQIRIWGVDAQRRLSKSHILVAGMTGTIVEFCKNIVLAGIGSVVLLDDRLVTREALSVNFLVPNDEEKLKGRSLAEVCCNSLKDFNSMVHVSVEKGDLSALDGEILDKFDAVVIGRASFATKKTIDGICRKRSKKIAFFTVDCRDSCGEIFVDLQNYVYNQKKNDDNVECQFHYPSLEEAVAVPWNRLPKNVTKLYFAMRVIERFEAAEGRIPGETTAADISSVQQLRGELCKANSINESRIPDELLKRLLEGTREHPPVCAIVGGILGQEVIKALSGKGNPLKNFFFFDAKDGKGIIEDISSL